MDLDSILRSMETDTRQEKIASAVSKQSHDSAALAAALTKVAEAETANAHFSNNDPVEGLLKMAETLAASEEERDLALASICGDAFADAAIAKLAAYESRFGNVKLASEGGVDAESVAEIAASVAKQVAEDTALDVLEDAGEALSDAEDPGTTSGVDPDEIPEDVVADVEKQAEAAYVQGWDQALRDSRNGSLEKKAADEYQAGWDQAMGEIYEAATHEFYKGAAEAEIIVQSILQNQAQGRG
jgi:hypothetical protein